ncbi:MAG TPA: hypothetical protein VNQ76_09340 [Planctomicrobium sp.]|nr:hypothetical protein [Planctomicrobium sp.]
MSHPVSPSDLSSQIINQVDAIIRASEEQSRPLEVDPARGELFDLFVQAHRAGLTGEESEPDLSADGLCAVLSERWGLKAAAQQSAQNQVQLSKEHTARMRSLWSVMRMWMEWTYAWQRWKEFH